VALSNRTCNGFSDPTTMFVLFRRNRTGRNLLQTDLKSAAPIPTDVALVDFPHDPPKRSGRLVEITAAVPESACTAQLWHCADCANAASANAAQAFTPYAALLKVLPSGPGSQRTTGMISDSTALIPGQLSLYHIGTSSHCFSLGR